MLESIAGKLPRIEFRCEAGFYCSQIFGVLENAAMSLTSFLDHVLPQTAHKRASRVVERQLPGSRKRKRRPLPTLRSLEKQALRR